jgi:hypothetical protein
MARSCNGETGALQTGAFVPLELSPSPSSEGGLSSLARNSWGTTRKPQTHKLQFGHLFFTSILPSTPRRLYEHVAQRRRQCYAAHLGHIGTVVVCLASTFKHVASFMIQSHVSARTLHKSKKGISESATTCPILGSPTPMTSGSCRT